MINETILMMINDN